MRGGKPLFLYIEIESTRRAVRCDIYILDTPTVLVILGSIR